LGFALCACSFEFFSGPVQCASGRIDIAIEQVHLRMLRPELLRKALSNEWTAGQNATVSGD
jgi:hypothetical protein